MNEINMTHEKLSRNALHRLGTLVLALCMALSLLPAVIPPADAAFSDAALDKLLNWGVINGYPDGALHPDWPLTRAEFVAMVNRAYGYKELGNTPFIDVPNNAWFRDDINIGYTANYFTGVSPRMAGPDQELTREQAMVLLARNMRMQPADGEVIEFTDGRNFSDWSRGYARAAKEAGVIGGYGDGSFKPRNKITRGEMAVMLQRALGTLINKPGTHTLSDVYGNVTISSPNVILKNSTIAGDLYITGGLSLGDVTLENVRVLGNIIIAGGGESESGESVILRNVQADSLIVDSIANQYLSLAAEGDTMIGEAILRTSAYVQDRTRPGEGLLTITLDSLPGTVFTLSGNLETVVNTTPNSTLNIAMGTVDRLSIDEKARGSTLHLDINSTVEELNLDTAATVTGVGDIGDLFVNAPGASVEMLPDTVTIRPGLTADIAGQTMNAQQAQESSADPRLHAGYPKVKNIAPTNATSVYSANKGGTVYWAVSNTTDGSIGEDELIEPTSDNTHIELNGATAIGQSNTEYTAALEKLVPDSNYYISTVMVDARGRRSPVKVASFATPDNTTPAFAKGYPAVMRNYCVSVMENIEINGVTVRVTQRDEDGYPIRNYRVQIAAMPNKSCVLYYALYPAGSTAPTAQQFRTGALGTPIRSGMEDAVKNRTNFIELTGLEELTNYDIYLCYIDADGARSSPVQKLTFKTVDGKPPRFQFDTPAVTQEQLTGLRLSVNVNENATVYWVATRDPYYIKTNDEWNGTEWWERACRQIESGTGGIRSGSVNARANADTPINITGLQPATRYYIFFVAKDAAGNYSEFFSEELEKNPGRDGIPDRPELHTPYNQQPYKYFITASTLDNIPPEVTWQEFTRYDTADPTQPYADTSIRLHFSEAVMSYEDNRNASQEFYSDLDTLYKNHLEAKRAYDAAVADGVTGEDLEALYDAWANSSFVRTLRKSIQLYNNGETGHKPVHERPQYEDWVIDYRYVTIENDPDSGEMIVVFPTVPDHPELSALNLASGSTYHFEIDDICDTSSNKNRMGHTILDNFTTISAQVDLREFNASWAVYDNPVKEKKEDIEIDMAFSLTPRSTSVEDDVMWDLLFWSDTSVEFEVYELKLTDDLPEATAIRPLNSSGQFSTTANGRFSRPLNVELDETPNPDADPDDYTGYLGLSYFAEFYQVLERTSPSRGFPSVTGNGNLLDRYQAGMDYEATLDVNPRGIMQTDVPKYYGIHFTKIEDEYEDNGGRSIWDATVNFRISVVTSSNPNALSNLSGNVSNRSIGTFAQSGGSLIHRERDFTMTRDFYNREAPQFDPDAPLFRAHDTWVDMTLTLEKGRTGTVHYLIVPATAPERQPNGTTVMKPQILINPTTARDGSNDGVRIQFHNEVTEEGNAHFERHYFMLGDTSGVKRDVHVPYDAADHTAPTYTGNGFDFSAMTSRLELEYPVPRSVYGNVNYGKSVIKSSAEIVPGMDPVRVTGLSPETIYLVYLVTQNQNQTYSDYALLYQFKTTKLTSPQLNVERRESSAFITIGGNPEEGDPDARVYAALFRADSLERLETFSDKFYDTKYMKEEEYARYASLRPDSSGRSYTDYAIWEAMRTPCPDELGASGTLFDYFANENTKNTVKNLIMTADPSSITGVVGPALYSDLLAGDTKGWIPDFTLEARQSYILFAVAIPLANLNATGDSLSFGAAYPLQKPDDSKPTITGITGSITVDYQSVAAQTSKDGFLMTGYIRIAFRDDLYLYYSGDPPTRDPLRGSELGDYFIEPETVSTTPAADRLFTARSVTTGSAANAAASSVMIDLRPLSDDGTKGGVGNNFSFLVNERLCTQYGSRREESQLEIQLRYDPGENLVYVEVVVNGKVTSDSIAWFPTEGYATITPTVNYPWATDFSTTPGSYILSEGQTAATLLTINPVPANGQGTVTLVSDKDFVTISPSTIRTQDNTPITVIAGYLPTDVVSDIATITMTLTHIGPDGQTVTVTTHTLRVTVQATQESRYVDVRPQTISFNLSTQGTSQAITVEVIGVPNKQSLILPIASDFSTQNSIGGIQILQVGNSSYDPISGKYTIDFVLTEDYRRYAENPDNPKPRSDTVTVTFRSSATGVTPGTLRIGISP